MVRRSLWIGELAAQVSLRPVRVALLRADRPHPAARAHRRPAPTRRRLSADRVDQDGAASRFASCRDTGAVHWRPPWHAESRKTIVCDT